MRVQYFDDGSTIVYDDANNVIGATDWNGVPVLAPSGESSLVRQFSELFNFGMRAIIDRAQRKDSIAAARDVAQLRQAQLPGTLASYMPLALLLVGAVVLYKVAVK